MTKLKTVVAPSTNPYAQQRFEEEKAIADAIRRESIFLARKAGRNPLAAGYYIQLKDLFEDLLMLELAQKAAEANIKFQTRNKVISIDDAALEPFRHEMEKAKVLKLVTGVLTLTGALNVEDLLDKVTTSLYGPKMPKQSGSKEPDPIKEIKKALDVYARKMEKLIKAQKE